VWRGQQAKLPPESVFREGLLAVTTPRFRSEEAFERWSDTRIDAWVLCAEFVERIVSQAHAEAANGPSEVVPDVDWAAIWRSGEGAPSDEVAIGRIVRAASDAAQAISRKQRGGPSPSIAQASGAEVLDLSGLATTPETGSENATAFEHSDVPARANGARVESLTAPPDRRPAPSGPSAPIAEPLAVPLTEPVATDALTVQQEPPTAQVGVVASEPPLLVAPAFGEEPDKAVQVAMTSDEARTDSPWFHVFTWTAVIGAIILLFLAWQLWGTSISQHHAQDQLKSQFQALEAQHAGQSHGSKSKSLIPAATRVASPVNCSVVAEIQIPAIGVDQYVVEGTADSDLSKGPGHYIGTAMPGQAGNVAIAGHRTTNGAPFNGLGHLVPGDRIILTTVYGQSFTYVVSGAPQAVSPSDVGVLNYFGDNRVTLTTCNPEFSSTQRLVVVGKLNQPGASPGVAAKNLSYNLANPATASWNWSLLPAVGVEVSLLLLLALSYRRFGIWFVGIGKWFILVPLWAAGLYLLFTTLTAFLPAAL
jgi:sortase A